MSNMETFQELGPSPYRLNTNNFNYTNFRSITLQNREKSYRGNYSYKAHKNMSL